MSNLTSLTKISCPTLVTASGERARIRFLEFFASNIRNPHTRRAYVRAVLDFMNWCQSKAQVSALIDIEPLHVAAWIELQTGRLSAPTVKQHLAAIRHLFDWLVVGQIVATNPASSVRGPSHRVKTGKTPILGDLCKITRSSCLNAIPGLLVSFQDIFFYFSVMSWE